MVSEQLICLLLNCSLLFIYIFHCSNALNLISNFLCRLGSRWTKHFCMYRKENKLFQMMSHSHGLNVVASSIGSKVTSSNLHPSNNGTIDAMIVKTCTRRITDTIDKRFCFDLEVEVGENVATIFLYIFLFGFIKINI